MNYQYEDLAKMLDHSLLNPQLTSDELEQGIDLALAYDVASVCIMPSYLKRCAERLAGSSVKASTTIGFPHGLNATATKVAETELMLAQGCEEFDMVVNQSRVLSGDWQFVREDINAVTETVHAAGQKVKVIFENCFLSNEQKIQLCVICSEVNADWVKTSTGFGTGGATHDDLKLMREHAADHVQVKAAGGIRDLEALIAARDLGATRCGATRTSTILDKAREKLGLPKVNNVDASTVSGSY